MLDKKAKERIIKKFKTHESDTGSTPIQIGILTEEIRQLTDHLKNHKKDFSSRRGLLKKVAERRKLLMYLKNEDLESYNKIVKDLKLKIAKLLDLEEDGKKEIAARDEQASEAESAGNIEAKAEDAKEASAEEVPGEK